MDAAAALAAFDERVRRGARPDRPGARIEHVGGVVRQTGSPEDWNGVLWSDLGPDTADTAIAEQVRHFRALGLEWEWKLYGHDRPVDLASRLREAGLRAEAEESLMVADVREVPAPGPPEGVRLCPVTDARTAARFAAVHEQVFGPDAGRGLRGLLDRLAEGSGTESAVVAMAGDEAVSAARMELYPGTGFAGLWGGGTLPRWRGKGIYRALVGHRARIAAEQGYDWLQVDASAMSRPVLERLGFTVLTTTTPYVHRPADG